MKKIGYLVFLGVVLLQGGVYKGKIGKYPVTMLLSDTTDDMNRYRYEGKLLSIPLIGKRITKLCEPAPKASQEEDTFMPAACFEGKLKGTVYSGQWHKVGSKNMLPFRLEMLELPQKTDSYGNPYSDEEFYYDLLKKEIVFRSLKKYKRAKGLRYYAVLEPVTKILQYRIELPDKKVQNQINKKFENIHRQSVAGQLWCLDEGPVDEAYDEYEIRIEYFGKPFLLLSYESSSDCGGAHPNNAYTQYLFDLGSGREIDYDHLFSIYQTDKEGDEVIKPAFQNLLHQYLLKESESIDCYHEEDNFHHLTLYPAEGNKIAVRLTGMGHAAFACELAPFALLPVGKMQPFSTEEAGKYYPQLQGVKK